MGNSGIPFSIMRKEEENIRICADTESKEESLVTIVTTTQEEKIILGPPNKILNSVGSLRIGESLWTACGIMFKSAITIDGVNRIIAGTTQNDHNGMLGGTVEAGVGFILAGRSLYHGVQRQGLISRIKNKLSGKIRSGLMENLDQ